MGDTLQQHLRITEAAKLMGVSRNTVWVWIRTDQSFPRPIQLSARITVLNAAELHAWKGRKQGIALGAQAGAQQAAESENALKAFKSATRKLMAQALPPAGKKTTRRPAAKTART